MQIVGNKSLAMRQAVEATSTVPESHAQSRPSGSLRPVLEWISIRPLRAPNIAAATETWPLLGTAHNRHGQAGAEAPYKEKSIVLFPDSKFWHWM